jgi:hypothetical protein
MNFLSPTLLRQAREYSGNPEQLVAFLRRAGLSKLRSVAAYAEVMNVSPAEAKRRVHDSDTWAERRDFDEQLHRAFGS